MHKIALSLISVVFLQSSAALYAAEFVGIRVNAENYTAKSDEWYLTSPDSLPNVQPDPDGPHITDASNGAYMELLPDTRVTHLDELISGGNFWGGSGSGPRLEYLVDVPEAGTYTVWVKMYATGTEDNGIHVGVNGTTPDSGERIQLCGGKNRWSWTSNQRTTDNHCGVTQTITLDIPDAGPNTIIFYAREDGFEIDQFILLKETSPDTEDCAPLLSDKIRCVDLQTGAQIDDTDLPLSLTIDGNTSTTDPTSTPAEIDLSLRMNQDSSAIQISNATTITLQVENPDELTATSVEVMVDLPEELGFEASGNCSESNGTITCQLGDITSGDTATESFQLTGLATGQHRIDGKASSDLVDPNADNNSVSLQIAVTEAPIIYDASIQATLSTNTTSLNGTVRYDIALTNEGMEAFPSHTVTLDFGANLLVSVPDLTCSEVSTGLVCDLPPTAVGESQNFSANLSPTANGNHTIAVIIDSQFDEVSENNSTSTSLSVVDTSIITTNGESLTLEAEDFALQLPGTTSDAAAPNWFRVSADTSNTPQPDPDDASPAPAGGGAYMEILPDRRLASGDDAISNVSNFPTPGAGPGLQYPVFIAEAGRYYVHALIRANGEQDNTLHIGVDTDWQETASNVSLCNPDGTWQWASAREIDGICDNNVQPYLDIADPGFYNINISQNEDGLELDRIFLTLSVSNIPQGHGESPTAYRDPDIDLQTSFKPLPADLTVNESVVLEIDVTNNNPVDTAVNAIVTIDGLGGLLDSGFQTADTCTRDTTNTLTCQIKSIAPGKTNTIAIQVTPTATDTLTLSSSVVSPHNDAAPENNSDFTNLEISSSVSGGGGVFTSLPWFLLLLLGSGARVIRTGNFKSTGFAK